MRARPMRIPKTFLIICALVGATGLLVGLFWGEVIFQRRVYALGDLARIYLPQRTVLQRALAARSLPWWTAQLGIGYPLLAEGEVGALYPLNWLLYGLLGVPEALNASLILHYLIAGAGFYAYARALGLSRAAAYLGSLVLTLGGFYVSHLSHVSILSVAAWLPWMFALTHALWRGTALAWGRALALALVVGLQFLAGHAQISLLGLMALGLYAACLAWARRAGRDGWRGGALWLGAMSVGLALGLPQLLPTFELGGLSQRAGGLDSEFFTSFSFHPFLLLTYLSPFVLGNPYPKGSPELMAYVGLLPLALAGVAVWRARTRVVWFYAGLALAGVALAFGRWNPLYVYLRHIPFLNLFRVPARYLYWTSFGLAVLAAHGLDALLALPRRAAKRRARMVPALVGALAVGAMATVGLSAGRVEQLVGAWRVLPLAFGLMAVGVVWAARWVNRSLIVVMACVALCADLYAYGAVLDLTYNGTLPIEEVTHRPRSADFLAQDGGLYRLYTKEEIVPDLSVQRESYYPNLGLPWGLSSANLYLPLVPRSYGDYLQSLTPERLNRLNVRYYLIPQLLPVDAASELYDVHNPLAALRAGEWVPVGGLDVIGLQIESYLSHAAQMRDGELAGELILRDDAGREVSIPLRAGIETAEWAYEREDVRRQVQHAMPRVASTFSARSGFPPGEHPGHTYLATVDLPAPMRLAAVCWRPVLPEAFVRLERVRLTDILGTPRLLAHMAGLGDHTLVYRSEDVLIYRNEDALPRAYTLPLSAVRAQGDALILPDRLDKGDVGAVEVLRYDDLRVELQARVSEESCLILADLAYPGWRAMVDGEPAPILRADGLFRAVILGPGEHMVTFAYTPRFGLP